MSKHFEREVEKLKQTLLAMSAVVEERVWQAVKAVESGDTSLALQVIEGDAAIDHMEVDIEEECLKILALYHPVAFDLRFIVAVLKMNNDLERIGDLACNIAQRAVALAACDTSSLAFDFHDLGAKVKSMLRRSLNALVNLDAETAAEICRDDDEVDAIYKEMFKRAKDEIRKQPESLDALLLVIRVLRHLERIADQATNIAEDVIYLAKGEIVRHKTGDLASAPERAGPNERELS